ncbi:MAG: SUF system NifU family Fe-S cluster assembly protein [Chromatiales bacterium]|nr:SUF system NifU family Fe-S cluster assembly protein [Chromatiales bacterium]
MAGPSLRDLYRQTVLDHSRSPRNFRRLEHPDCLATGHNALCGDKVSVYLGLAGDRLEDVSYEASGCAICMASASLMSERVTGLSRPEASRAIDSFVARFDPGSMHDDDPADPLSALATVREYPSRIRCATLPWETLRAAISGEHGTVSTE